MLKSLTLDQVRKIIGEAEQLNAKHPPSEHGISLLDVTQEDIIAYANDEKKLKQEIAALSYDARMELMALMWIGRDGESDFDEAVKHAHRNSDDGDVPYIAEKSPALPTYLRNGLKQIGLPAPA